MSKNTSRIISAIFRQIRSRPSFDSIGIAKYRQLLEKGARAFKPDKDISVRPFNIDKIEAEWLVPSNCRQDSVILYTHGGGFIAGSINSHRDLASRVAKASNTQVLIYNYRLAPEHPFPQGLNDAKTVYSWLMGNIQESAKISFAGDSAGAGLNLSLALDLLDRKARLPSCIAMLSPWIDLECENNSHEQNYDKDFMLSQSLLKTTARMYSDQDMASPQISPINGSFQGLPPVKIQTGGHEILLNDSKRLERRLKKANINTSLEIWDKMFHAWHYFARYLPEARDAIQRIGEFIQIYG